MSSDLNLKVLLELRDKASGPLRDIAKGNDALVKGLQQAQAQMEKLAGQQSAIKKFQALKEKTRGARDAMQAAQAKLQALTNTTDLAGKTQRKHNAEIRAAEKAVQRLGEKHAALLTRLRSSRDAMKAAGIANVARAQAALPAQIEKATAALERQRQALEQLDQARAKHKHDMMRGGAMAATGWAMTRSASRLLGTDTGALGQYMAHEDAMLGIARQVPGARNEMGQLTEVYRQAERDVRALSQALPLTTVEIANMMTAAARMEVPTEHLKDQVRLAAEMAVAFDAVPDEIAESMGKVAKNFRIPVTDIRGLADTINYLDDNAISKGGDIIDFLNRTSGVLSTVAISDRQAAALGSTLLTLGERAETAGTATNAIFQKFAAGAVGDDALKELGLTAKALEQGMSRDAMGTLLDVIERINALPEQRRMGVMLDMVGLHHSDTLAKLATKPDELRRQLELATGGAADGSMAREAAARFATASAKMQLLKNQWFNLQATAGEALVPVLMELTQAITPLLAALAQWVQANPKLAAGLMAAAAAAGPLMMLLGVAKMGKSIWVVSRALSAAGLAAKGAAPAVSLLSRAGAAMSRAWAAALPWIMRAGAMLRNVGVWGVQALASAWAKGLPLLAKAGSKLLWLGRIALGALLTPMGLIAAAVATAVFLIWKHWDTLWPKLSAIWQSIKAAGMDGLNWFRSLPERMWQAGSDMIGGLINGVTAKLGALRDTMVGVADNAASWFKGKLGIHSPSRVFMQLGGWVSEGAALGIARRAPMVARAAAAMAALPALAAAPAMAQGAQPLAARTAAPPHAAYHITINAQPGQDAQAIARAVSAELDRRQRQSAARGYSRLGDR